MQPQLILLFAPTKIREPARRFDQNRKYPQTPSEAVNNNEKDKQCEEHLASVLINHITATPIQILQVSLTDPPNLDL